MHHFIWFEEQPQLFGTGKSKFLLSTDLLLRLFICHYQNKTLLSYVALRFTLNLDLAWIWCISFYSIVQTYTILLQSCWTPDKLFTVWDNPFSMHTFLHLWLWISCMKNETSACSNAWFCITQVLIWYFFTGEVIPFVLISRRGSPAVCVLCLIFCLIPADAQCWDNIGLVRYIGTTLEQHYTNIVLCCDVAGSNEEQNCVQYACVCSFFKLEYWYVE